jgi:hypothetical protein
MSTTMKLTQEQIAAVHALEDENGNVFPHQVLKAAKDKTNPLHALYDWDIKRAAEKHWLHQSRLILGAVTILVTTQEFTYKSSAYVSSGTGDGYRNVMVLKNDPNAGTEILIHCLETSAGHLKRALTLAIPLGLSDDIDRLITQVMSVVRVVQRKDDAAA